jgi:hypothetical protein
VAVRENGGTGTNTAALSISGLGLTAATEEWNAPYSATETITLTT